MQSASLIRSLSCPGARERINSSASLALQCRFSPRSAAAFRGRMAFSGFKTARNYRMRVSCAAKKPSDAHTVSIHYHRDDGEYKSWGLHVWGCPKVATKWESPMPPTGKDEFGVFWELNVDKEDVASLKFIVHKGDVQDGSGAMSQHNSAWIVSTQTSCFYDKPDLANLPHGDLHLAKAFWVQKDMLAWTKGMKGAHFYLHASKTAHLHLTGRGIEGADTIIELGVDPGGLPPKVVAKFPHIAGCNVLRLPHDADVNRLVKCQLALGASNAYGAPIDASGVQLPGVLDDMFKYDGPLGVTFTSTKCTFQLWAPTAQNVRLLLYSKPSGGKPEKAVPCEEKDGVWSASGPRYWVGMYYLYEITVFHPLTLQIETSHAIDPYSRGLSANGERSLIVDLSDAAAKPKRWDTLAKEKPKLDSFNDIAIYELHIRDFSAMDKSIPENLRGTFLAFAQKDCPGVVHLRNLAKAGLTHLHLLPSFDFGSVDEIRENWKTLDLNRLEALPPDSEEQQAAVLAIQNEDGFNWGYDPVNWGVPDGSYATDPNGPARILEFRTMVQALNRIGLRVVLDVVYNHLHGNGPQDRLSVLDKVVPGYYLRRNLNGYIENSTCMNNTASEHYMADRLIVDDLLMWAKEYKVDGFRFDLMGHIMKSTLTRAKALLQALTLEKNGVDGSKIYMYGEGWDFGEVYKNGRGVNGTQLNVSGTGIGSFNDRIRDSAIGGSPFGDPLDQGMLTGLSLQPNSLHQGDSKTMAENLARHADRVILGLVGNLKDYVFVNFEGKECKGSEVLTHDGAPVAYASAPVETVNYMSAHDNETLFDIIMMKAAEEVSLEERCRINNLAMSIVALSQGVAFFHAGDDLLRSKSLDRDSYNSGDWFNRLDFTYETNNWAVGLPPRPKNESKWPFMRKLLSNKSLKPTKKHIMAAVNNLQELLKIRFSSPLFRLKTTNAVQARVNFDNAGPASVPGVIVMSLHDGEDDQPGLTQIDPNYRTIVVIFNARPDEAVVKLSSLRGFNLDLHPVQADSSDDIVKKSLYANDGTFNIPARTTAVFVERRSS